MARYGRDFGHNDRWGGQGRMDRGFGAQGGYGGMRSDGWGSSYRDFPGEEGWYGQGFEGYPSGGYGGGYDVGFRGRENWGARPSGERGYREMGAMNQGVDFQGGYGGYNTGYQGRDFGYGRGTRNVGERGGWRRGGTQTRASEIMTENPETVTPDATLADVAKKMKELDVGIIPVVESAEGRRLRGVITDRDIAIRAVAEGKDGKAKVSDCMTAEVSTVNKNDSVREVLDLMEREQVRRVPVVDRENRLVGIIAQADLAVDYGEGSPRHERMVEHAVERISEPARPERARAMQAGGRNRQSQGTQGTTEGIH